MRSLHQLGEVIRPYCIPIGREPNKKACENDGLARIFEKMGFPDTGTSACYDNVTFC